MSDHDRTATLSGRLSEGDRAVIAEAHALATDLVDELRTELRRRFGSSGADVKRDGSLVTDVDVAVNERVVEAIAGRFPDHVVVSEEMETRYDGEDWAWVVDPIDGTTNFVRGVPYWCVSIALALRGRPVLGVVDAPALGDRYVAVLGEGATRNDEPISVRDVDWDDHERTKHALLAVSSGVGKYYVLDLPLRPRAFGSAALHLCVAASGVAAATLQPSPRIWDVAAGVLLVEEAGGALLPMTDRDPFPLEPGRDYGGHSLRFVAAASAATARRVAEGIRLRERDERFLLPGD